MQQPIGKNDPAVFSTVKENQCFDRKSARKDTKEISRHTRWARNPIIARTLTEFGWVRELNEGVQRIYDEMASFFLNDPIFEEPNDASVQLTLFARSGGR